MFVGGKLFGVMFGDVVSNELGGLVYAVYVVGDWSWAVALVVQTSLLFPVPSKDHWYSYKINYYTRNNQYRYKLHQLPK